MLLMKSFRIFQTIGMLVLGIPLIQAEPVSTGLDRVVENGAIFKGQRIGIMANQTARDRQGRFIVDVFRQLDHCQVTALYAPEHGLWGKLQAGDRVDSTVHPEYQIPVFSLYGAHERTRKPNLENVDLLVFDMQDVGARFYTYVSSMARAMEAAAHAGKRFVVLDRPNPLGGRITRGPILDPNYTSFVGLFPIPLVHGLTVGELARLFNGAGWLGGQKRVNLTVIPMVNWQRSLWYDQTGLPFIKPSPNLPDLESIVVYPGTALIEGTNVSEGRGTDRPFRQIGAPWIDSGQLTDVLNELQLSGIRFTPTSFTPRSSKHQEALCHGVRLQVINRDRFDSFAFGFHLVQALYRLYPGSFRWRLPHFDRLCGTDQVRKAIESGAAWSSLEVEWNKDRAIFRKKVEPYLLYP